MKRCSRVSIGLPVFNGEVYLRQAIEAHLAQTYGDFELIISDNASADGTYDICAEYCRLDERIRLVRQPANCGVNRNHMKVFALAGGEYFRWAAVDDIPSPDLLNHAVATLDQDRAVVAYVPATVNIDQDGRIGNRLPRTLDIRDESPVERALAVLTRDYQMVFPQGLMRRDALLSTNRQWHFFGWDFVLLFELALQGHLCHLEGPLLYRRLHKASAAHCTRKISEVRKWVDPTVRSRILMPHWKWAYERCRAVVVSKLPVRDRVRLLALLARHSCWDRKALTKDVVMAAKVLLARADEYPF